MLSLYNTLTRKKEKFQPIDAENVRMYVCGPTVYDFAHLGNARPVVVFDTLYRLLKRHYAQVTYVRNITDIDDKIMNKARETGEPIDSITTRTTQAFHDDMAALNAERPTHEPRATWFIKEMVAMIETLIAKGHAYAAEGHVLFNVPSMPNYGELSRRSKDELIAGARVDVAPYKKDATDFVLWKPSTHEQSGWDSPWGRGRPGWHIECSAMAAAHLGETFDIHGGGLDLIFPHHENEIAQSRCSHNGAPLANVWMHNGFLTINNDKMSKSLGNFFTVRQLLEKYHGEVIRLALLTAHYRSPLDFTLELLDDSKKQLDKFYRILELSPRYTEAASEIESQNRFSQMKEKFYNWLNDDLNTHEAIAILHEMASFLRVEVNAMARDHLTPQFQDCADALGLLKENPEAWFKWQPSGKTGLYESDIQAHIDARIAAKKAKNFAEADRIRDSLLQQGIILEDSAAGTTWRRK